MVHPASDGMSRVPSYSSANPTSRLDFTYGAITLFGGPFQWPSIISTVFVALLAGKTRVGLATRPVQRLQPSTHRSFGLFPVRSPLLRESHLLFVPPGTEMFQFSGFASDHLCIQWPMTDLQTVRRVSPFGYPRVKACLAADRGFSQPSTSFVAGRTPIGIHRTPFVA